MKRFKIFISAVLIVSMLTVTAACGDTGGDPHGTNAPTGSAPVQSDKADDNTGNDPTPSGTDATGGPNRQEGQQASLDFLAQAREREAVNRDLSLSDPELAGAVTAVIDRLNAFSVDLLKSLPRGEQITSPLSLYFALVNLRMGMQGESRVYIDNVLKPDDLSDALYEKALQWLAAELSASDEFQDMVLEMSQLVVAQEGLTWNEAYLQRVKPLLTDAGSLDFQNRPDDAVRMLNAWANDRTRGLIPEIFDGPDSLDPNTVLMLLNAIYFKGQWHTEFNEERDDVFYGADGEKTMPFMDVKDRFAYGEKDGIQYIEVPYYGGAFMQIALGGEDSDINDVAEHLFALADGDLNSRDGYLKMPAFQIKSEMDLQDSLMKMGLGELFDSLGETDYFTETEGLYVGKAKQLINLKVNSKGTEAAAVTVIEVDESAIVVDDEQEPFEMIVNRPFAFRVIYQGMPLFCGTVTRP